MAFLAQRKGYVYCSCCTVQFTEGQGGLELMSGVQYKTKLPSDKICTSIFFLANFSKHRKGLSTVTLVSGVIRGSGRSMNRLL